MLSVLLISQLFMSWESQSHTGRQKNNNENNVHIYSSAVRKSFGSANINAAASLAALTLKLL